MPSFALDDLSKEGKGRGFRHYLEKLSLDFSRVMGGHVLVPTLSLKQSQMSVMCTTCRGSCVSRDFALWYLWFSSLA